MKKLLFSASLALLAWGLTATPSFAHAFGLFTCHRCCHGACKRGCMTFCCKQYNAFTPVCCGSICCDGCCPFGGGGPGPGYGPLACGPGGCDGAVSDLPAGATPVAPATPATGPALPSKPLPTGTTSLYPPAPGYGAVQSAGYFYPGYSYGYAPAANYGYAAAYGPASGYGPMVAPAVNPMAVPAYWNSDR
jgi:hypothetical protein